MPTIMLLKTSRALRVWLMCIAVFAICSMAQAEVPDYTRVYHPVVQMAELEILYHDYAKALENYQEAFANVPTPFARDYYNAAVCAWMLKDQKQTLQYMEKLVGKGVSLDYLERQEVFDSLRTTQQWEKFVRKYPKRRAKFEETLDKELRANLDELYARDQYFREAAGGFRANGDTIRQIEEANLQYLLAWIETYGYPGENLIGVADTLEDLPRFSIVIQRQTKARRGYDFTEILTKAVQEGKLAPHAAAYLLDQQEGKSLYGAKAIIKVNCSQCSEEDEQLARYMEERKTESEVQRMNERRAALGMEPFELYQQKVLFSIVGNPVKLNYPWSVVYYMVPSKEAANVMLEGLTTAR